MEQFGESISTRSYSGAPPISRRNYWIFKVSTTAIVHTTDWKDVSRSEPLRDLRHEYGLTRINGSNTVEGCTKRQSRRNGMNSPVSGIVFGDAGHGDAGSSGVFKFRQLTPILEFGAVGHAMEHPRHPAGELLR